MDVLWYTLSAIGLGSFLAAKWVDWSVTLKFPLCEEYEANKLTRDSETGYLSLPKSLLINLGVGAALGVAFAFLFHPAAAAIWPGGFSLYLWPNVLKNRRDVRAKLEAQFSILRVIKQGPETYRAKPIPEHAYGNVTRIWYAAPHFYDVRVEAQGAFEDWDEIARARDELSAKMRRLAEKPESEWGKVSRSKDL